MEGGKINSCRYAKDFLALPENRRIILSVGFLERLAEKKALRHPADDPAGYLFPMGCGI